MKKFHLYIDADLISEMKGRCIAITPAIESFIGDLLSGRIFCVDGHWYSTETPMQRGEQREEQREEQKEEQKEEPKANPVSANDMLSVTVVPERAQGNVFEYQQRWNLKYLVDISKDLASYRKELKSSYGTDGQQEAMNAIIGLKFGNGYNGGDLNATPNPQEPTLYNFFQWKGLTYLAEQIDSLIQDVIDIDKTEDEEEYEPDLNYAD